jgi:cysteine desulfurase NifS
MAGNKSHPKVETVDGLCGICPAGCWVRISKRDGRMVKVEPFPDHPMGTICTIGRHSPEIVYDPDRLRYPQRRVGKKGSYELEQVSWDVAYQEIAEQLQAIKRESGPEATAIYTGRGSFDMAMCDLLQPAGVSVSSASSVLFPFGSPNTLGVGALCYVSFAMIAPDVTLGETYITMDTDLEQAELIVVWGANPATDSPPLAQQQIVAARQRGAEVVVIDPQRSLTAREVDAEWLPIRPGTDGALALGLIQVLLEEEMHDEELAASWTVGFDELAQMVQHYRPEVVAEITGVDAETLRSLARRIATARGACPVMYTGLEYSDSGVQAIRAVLILWALAGQLDVPGGLLLRMKENLFPQNRSRLIANPDLGKALGRDRFPVYSAYRGESHAITLPPAVLDGEPYKIRALIVLGGSIITSWPNPELWRKTLEALDLLVCIDRYPTADAAYADFLLPATTQYEIMSFMRYGPMFKLRERIIEPVGEARNDFLILAGLADRLGYGHLLPQSEEAIVGQALEGSGFTLEQVRAAGGSVQLPAVMMEYKKWEKGRRRNDGQPGFNTPSGKIEIASSILAEHGYEPLPVYTEPREGPLARPDLAERYPLVFNSGTRTCFDFRSQHHGVKGLSKHHPVPLVTINSEDAAERGIEEGDQVWVESPRGQVRMTARVTSDIVRGSIDANQGGGGPLGPRAWQECNVNQLTNLEHYDPISGFPVYKTLLCQVTRADEQDGQHHRRSQLNAREPVRPARQAEQPRRQVYLDHAATTPIDPDVLEAMLPFLSNEFGNPSSIHSRGAEARKAVEQARRSLAALLDCTARRIIFTGGGSEANNLAIKSVAAKSPGSHIITSAIEHPAVLATCRYLETIGHQLTVLPVSPDGLVNPEDLAKALRPSTVLVSIMLANNELGNIQPITELARITSSHPALLHTDAVQALAKIPVHPRQLGVDLLTMSAHKLHGPKGIGALYLRRGLHLSPLVHGGEQEQGVRAGTENVAGIVGFGKACELAQQRLLSGAMEQIAKLRNHLARGVEDALPGARVNAEHAPRLPVALSMTLPEIRGESLVLLLDRHGISLSSGSACKSGNPAPSHVLLAIGLSEAQVHCSVRFSLGAGTTRDDIDYTIERLTSAIATSRSSVRFVSCR